MSASTLTPAQQEVISHSRKSQINGWTHVQLKGTAREIGFQMGYHLAEEYKDAIRVYTYMTYESFGLPYSFFAEAAVKLHKDKFPQYQIDEMTGIAEGINAAGIGLDVTLDDIIAWNDWMEITGYWWPSEASNYMKKPTRVHKKSHCSAIMATGSATADGKPVFGHESFDEFWSGQYFNVCVDITPEDGNRFVMQAPPCCICSMTDFYVTESGLGITETTLAGFDMYDPEGVPECARIRDAVQFSSTIDEFVDRLNRGNNGGYANAWLIADNKTGEIARYEQGLRYQALERTMNGAYFGCNAVFDPRIRNLECSDNGYNDPRQQTGARRIRFMELIEKYDGKIDLPIVKKILADTYDPYLGYENPSSRCICSHYDCDPQYYADDPHGVWNVPFYPAGSCDAKAASSEDIANLSMWGRYGRADGVEFDVEEFFKQHPQWKWQEGYLKSRPAEPWTHFKTDFSDCE